MDTDTDTVAQRVAGERAARPVEKGRRNGVASSRGGTQTEGTGGTLENEQARQIHFPLADPRARRTGVHQLTPRLHLHLIQAYALVHAGEFQCSSPPASLSQQTGETSLGAIVVTPFSNRPRRPPSPALARPCPTYFRPQSKD